MERNEWNKLEKELDELINDLQAKCARYEAALKDIAIGKLRAQQIAIEALSREGEKLTPQQIAERTDAINWYRNPGEEKEVDKEVPDWVEWLCDRSPDVPDLTESTDEEKKLLIDALFQSTGVQFMKMFYAVGLEKFMESGIVNDSTGDLFRLRFELMQKGHKNQKEDKQ